MDGFQLLLGQRLAGTRSQEKLCQLPARNPMQNVQVLNWRHDSCFLNQITCSDHLDGLKIKQSLRHSWLERAWRQSSLWFTQTMLSCSFCNCSSRTHSIHFLDPSSSAVRSSTWKLYKHHPSHEFLFLLFIDDAMPFHSVHSQCSSGSNSHSLALSLAPMKVDLSELALTHPQKWSYSPVLQFPTEGVEYPLQDV